MPRKIVEFGCPVRRGCDASESFGASLKAIIHQRVVRRGYRLDQSGQHVSSSVQSSKDPGKKWAMTFKHARVQQAFRHVCLRRKLVENAAYTHLRTREHTLFSHQGVVTKPAVPSELDMKTRGSSDVRVGDAMKVYVEGETGGK